MSNAELTADGRYLVVNGRRWRATDPSIPEKFRQELVDELMSARRLVKTDPSSARHRVQDAKLALGERGEPWWEPPTEDGIHTRIAATTCALLRHRQETTICPSDVARAIGGSSWRDLMDTTREVARELTTTGHVIVTQRGVATDISKARGPVRLAAGPEINEPRSTRKS